MNWAEFTQASPELADLFRERLDKTGLALIGSIRKDGTPRISPLEADVFEDHLLLGMMWQSRKALDLLRDPRCLVHSVVANKDGKDGEVKVRGPCGRRDGQGPARTKRPAFVRHHRLAPRGAVPPLLA